MFWLPEKFVAEAFAKLDAKYQVTAVWRKGLTDRVFGQAQYRCTRCGFTADDDSDCPSCSREVGVPIPLRFGGYAVEPARVEYTAFGRRRLYEGRRKNGANALASQHPQSCGASMWNITFTRLHGYDPIDDRPWPAPDGILRYDPREPWSSMFKSSPIFVATGTYDSFYVECPVERREDTLAWLIWTMEQPWRELDGWRFPAEGFTGYNLGKHSEVNANGLNEVNTGAPLTMAQSPEWR